MTAIEPERGDRRPDAGSIPPIRNRVHNRIGAGAGKGMPRTLASDMPVLPVDGRMRFCLWA